VTRLPESWLQTLPCCFPLEEHRCPSVNLTSCKMLCQWSETLLGDANPLIVMSDACQAKWRPHIIGHFLGPSKVLLCKGFSAGLVAGRISKRNGRVNLNQAIFGNICLVSVASTAILVPDGNLFNTPSTVWGSFEKRNCEGGFLSLSTASCVTFLCRSAPAKFSIA